MKTNNPSESNKLKNQTHEQDVKDKSNEKRSMNQMSGSSDKSTYKSNKGTGMSSEAGSNQNEKSWQDTGGSNPTSMQNNDKNLNPSSTGSGNMSNSGSSMNNRYDQDSNTLNTDKIKNQSNQQRRSSMGDGTPEMQEKDLKKSNLPDEELNDVDWNNSKSKNK